MPRPRPKTRNAPLGSGDEGSGRGIGSCCRFIAKHDTSHPSHSRRRNTVRVILVFNCKWTIIILSNTTSSNSASVAAASRRLPQTTSTTSSSCLARNSFLPSPPSSSRSIYSQLSHSNRSPLPPQLMPNKHLGINLALPRIDHCRISRLSSS